MFTLPETVLLASHGTPGALQAEAWLLDGGRTGLTTLIHLLVTPEFWTGMQGDDWLNNAATRDDFAHYLEGELAREAAAQVSRLAGRCRALGVLHRPLLRFGDPTACLLQAAAECGAELVVVGPRRPRGQPGYRSRLDLERLSQRLTMPLLVARP